MANSNGLSPTWKWLTGVLITLLLVLGGLLYGQTQKSIESKASASEVKELARRMVRIEDKLDMLLIDRKLLPKPEERQER